MPNRNFDTIDRYMRLFDRGAKEPAAVDELIALFADDAVVDIAGHPLTGQAVTDLYRMICEHVADSYHHWTSEQLPDGIVKVVWGSSARLNDGNIDARAGVEHFTFNDQGLITHLRNDLSGILSPGRDETP
jgi:hypothetical protein